MDNSLMKIIGWSIVFLVGLPALIGSIWAVGLIQGMTSSQILTELPRQTIQQLPDITNDIFYDLKKENADIDPAARLWIEAVDKVEKEPGDILVELGVMDWLKTEAAGTLENLDQMMRGERPWSALTVNMRPLKQSLNSNTAEDYMKAILANLPPCTQPQISDWLDLLRKTPGSEVPACDPGEEVTVLLTLVNIPEQANIPDEVVLTENVPYSATIDMVLLLSFISLMILLLPALIILFATVLITSTTHKRLLLAGIILIMGALAAYATSAMALYGIRLGLFASGWQTVMINGERINQLSPESIRKLAGLFYPYINQLLNSVINLSQSMGVFGLVLVSLSYVSKDKNIRSHNDINVLEESHDEN